MAVLKCKMCGGDIEVSQDKTFGTCDSCGSTMTFPKIDDDQRANMFNRGNHFRRIGEFDKALAVYERILQEDDTDAEAHWCCVLCRFGIEYVEDPATFEFLPTCHRASFDSILEDVDYLAAIDHSDGITRRQYQKEAVKISEVQKGILATSQNEEPFDVFICYKESEDDGTRTHDSTYAQDIYYQLTEQGWRVFFSRITLEDKAGTEYEPYIFAALNSAKVMIVVTTSEEHANAVWVKNEWSRFLALMRKDRSKILIPCYRDMDPYDLPEALSVLQSYDMNKIGFIQDLIRGVNKVLNVGKETEPVKENVVIQQVNSGADIQNLIRRGYISLEDKDWEKAKELFDNVLNIDAENADAYLGMMLAENCYEDQQKFAHDYIQGKVQSERHYNRAKQFASNGLQQWFEQIENDKRVEEERQKEEERKERIRQEEIRRKKEEEQRAQLERQRQRDAERRKERIQRLNNRRELIKSAQLIATGWRHTVGLCANGMVKAVGDNSFGQNDTGKWHDIVAIAAGGYHTVGLKNDGTLIATGRNTYCECDIESWNDIIAIAAGAFHTVGLQRDGTVVAIGDNSSGQCDVESWKDIIGVAAGASHTMGLKTDGTVVAVGFNNKGQCNVSNWSEIVAISGANNSSVGLRIDGTVVAVGENGYGQCNVSNWTEIVAIASGDYHTLGVKAGGRVVASGANNNGRCDVGSWTGIVSVAGYYNSVGLKEDGTLIAVGNNDHGQCEISDWKLFNNYKTIKKEREKGYEQARVEREKKTIENENARKKLIQEKQKLDEELSSLKGLFAGKQRKAIESRLEEIERELQDLC